LGTLTTTTTFRNQLLQVADDAFEF